MTTAYVTVTLIAIAANGFSGIAALLHFQPILPGMAKAGVPVSWLTFPIGTLKTAGALGLAAGLVLRPLAIAAAIGLVLFFVCASTRTSVPAITGRSSGSRTASWPSTSGRLPWR